MSKYKYVEEWNGDWALNYVELTPIQKIIFNFDDADAKRSEEFLTQLDAAIDYAVQAQLKRERELTDELVTSINDYLSSESVYEAVLREVDLEERIAAIHSEREKS